MSIGKSLAARLLPARHLRIRNELSMRAVFQMRTSVDIEKAILEGMALQLATEILESRGLVIRPQQDIRTGSLIWSIDLEVAPPGAFADALAKAWQEGFDAKVEAPE